MSPMNSTPPRIVFLDRDSLQAAVRRPAFAHDWAEYPASTAQEAVARLAGASIAITNKVPLRADAIAQLPDLKMVAIAATGSDNVDLAACRARGIVVANIRNYSLVSVPEHCLSLILALRRQLQAYRADVAAGKWQQSSRFCLLDHPIADLAGSRLGIVGYGALGRKVAQLGRAFGMQVCVATRSPPSLVKDLAKETAGDAAKETANDAAGDADGIVRMPLAELLRTADVISLHLPLTEQTRHLIGAPELAAMKPTALLINTARGGLVDEAALARALLDGAIGGAGFDVLSKEPPEPANPLLAPAVLALPNFILTPHVAWASSGAMQTLADMLIENIDAFQAGSPINTL